MLAICDLPLGGNHGWHYFCKRIQAPAGWTAKKILTYDAEFYTLAYAGYCVSGKHYHTYFHTLEHYVRKQRKLPGVFLCLFLTKSHDCHRSRSPPFPACFVPRLIGKQPVKKFFWKNFEKPFRFGVGRSVLVVKGDKRTVLPLGKIFWEILKNLSGFAWADSS